MSDPKHSLLGQSLTQVLYAASGHNWKLAATKESNYLVIETQVVGREPEYYVQRSLQVVQGGPIKPIQALEQASAHIERAVAMADSMRKEHAPASKVSDLQS